MAKARIETALADLDGMAHAHPGARSVVEPRLIQEGGSSHVRDVPRRIPVSLALTGSCS